MGRATGVRGLLLLGGLALLCVLLAAIGTSAQDTPPSPAPPNPEAPAPPPVIPEEPNTQVVINATGACIQPPPMVTPQDYTGPLSRVVGTFTQKLDRLSVHDVHYKPGAVLCSLEVKDKFLLFVRDAVDPETFLAAGWDAGISQAENHDPTFGQGFQGYAKRYGAAMLDQAEFRFFKEFAYPTIFAEDPRYYRLGQGSKKRRFLHAMKHSIIAYNDHGHQMFNASEWLGEVSGTLISDQYHPGIHSGVGPVARGVLADVGLDMGYDEIREFWPEIARKLHLPFRYQNEQTQVSGLTPR